MSENKETTVVNSFTALSEFNLQEAMTEELAGLDVSFERVKIPSGGGIMFEVPGDNPNEPDTLKDFTAVIIHHHPVHSYYRNKYTGGNQPPDCGSIDGVTGVGEPGGSCAACPLNEFGSGENDSKACKTKRRIYLLRENEIFPLLLSLPTGSLKEYAKYLKRLLSKGRKSNMVVTKFSLKKATNSGGVVYSQAQFEFVRVLTADEQRLILPLTEQMKSYSEAVSFEEDAATE